MKEEFNPDKMIKVSNERYRQWYHIQTPGGWLNDPNGLCYFKGYYHVFYQFHPYSAEWGPMHWGHVRSKDLVHWEQLPIALTPGAPEDKGGCFSGSAIIKDNRLYLFYTGHNYYDDNDLDHFWENQNMAYSDDGIIFHKYAGNPIIKTPADNTQHFRDPKVWEHNGCYYMVVGSQDKENKLGRILMYKSTDLEHWESCGPIIQSHNRDAEGWMWECPDLFTLGSADVLLCSPMGMKSQPEQFMNLSQVCYSVGHLDYQQHCFDGSKFRELDHGHNFYATQTMLTPDNRRIFFGWLSPFNEKMAEQADGWAGSLTLPRELVLEDGQLKNRPVKELAQLRQTGGTKKHLTLNGEAQVSIKDAQHAEYLFDFDGGNLTDFQWSISDQRGLLIKINCQGAKVTLYRRGTQDQYRYATLTAPAKNVHIFVDTSSVECFINDGTASFTERYYATGKVTAAIAAKGVTLDEQAYVLGKGEE